VGHIPPYNSVKNASREPFEGCYLIYPARGMLGEFCFACDVTRQGALKNTPKAVKYLTVYRKYELKALFSRLLVGFVHYNRG
jgi:hypothetical protein